MFFFFKSPLWFEELDVRFDQLHLEVKFQNTNIIFWGWFLAVGSHLGLFEKVGNRFAFFAKKSFEPKNPLFEKKHLSLMILRYFPRYFKASQSDLPKNL